MPGGKKVIVSGRFWWRKFIFGVAWQMSYSFPWRVKLYRILSPACTILHVGDAMPPRK